MSIQTNEIESWLADHRDEMVEELKRWVSIPSVSRADLAADRAPYGPDCRKMLDYALQRGKDYGFKTVDNQGYCGDIILGDAEDEFGFVCHLDVVPEGDGWIFEPYKPVEKDGFLIGRGVGDNKGSAILSLFVLRFFQEKKIPLKKSLRLMLGCAEETGMADFKTYFGELGGHAPSLSIVADCMFPVCYAQKGGIDGTIHIPAGKNIVSFEAGLVRNSIPDTARLVLSGVDVKAAKDLLSGYADIEVSTVSEGVEIIGHGKAGHAAFPENSRNAIVLVAQAVSESGIGQFADITGLDKVAAYFGSYYGAGLGIDFSDEATGKLTLNIGVIQKKESELQGLIDIRYPVSYTGVQIVEIIKEKLTDGAALTDVEIASPYYADPNSNEVKALTEIYQEISGDTRAPFSMGGGTYSRVVPNAITYGPGFPVKRKASFLPEGHGGAHGRDEALYIEDWLKAFKIYVLTVERLAGEKAGE